MGKTGRLTLALSVVSMVTLGLTGCAGLFSDLSPKASTPTPTATQEPTPKPTEEPAPAEEPWERFADPRLEYTFELPPGWSAELAFEDPEYSVAGFDLVDESGATQLHFAQRVMGLGGGCTDTPSLPITELDSVPFDLAGYVAESADTSPATLVQPRFVYRVLELDSGVVGSVAVIDDEAEEYCFYYNLLHTDKGLMSFADTLQFGHHEPPHVFGSLAEAQAFMQTDEYRTLKRVLLSLETVR